MNDWGRARKNQQAKLSPFRKRDLISFDNDSPSASIVNASRGTLQRSDLASPNPSKPVPGGLHEVLIRGLEPRPEHRFASMHELIEGLNRLLGDSKSYGRLFPQPERRVPQKPHHTRWAVSIVSAHEVANRWLPADPLRVISVFGRTVVDFRDAILAQPVTDVRCLSILGNTELTVPDDIPVKVDGSGVIGIFEKNGSAPTVSEPGAPRLRVTGSAILGRVVVRIVTRGEKNAGGENRA